MLGQRLRPEAMVVLMKRLVPVVRWGLPESVAACLTSVKVVLEIPIMPVTPSLIGRARQDRIIHQRWLSRAIVRVTPSVDQMHQAWAIGRLGVLQVKAAFWARIPQLDHHWTATQSLQTRSSNKCWRRQARPSNITTEVTHLVNLVRPMDTAWQYPSAVLTISSY